MFSKFRKLLNGLWIQFYPRLLSRLSAEDWLFLCLGSRENRKASMKRTMHQEPVGPFMSQNIREIAAKLLLAEKEARLEEKTT